LLGVTVSLLLRVDQEHVEEVLVRGGVSVFEALSHIEFPLLLLLLGFAVDVACDLILQVNHFVVSKEDVAVLEELPLRVRLLQLGQFDGGVVRMGPLRQVDHLLRFGECSV